MTAFILGAIVGCILAQAFRSDDDTSLIIAIDQALEHLDEGHAAAARHTLIEALVAEGK